MSSLPTAAGPLLSTLQKALDRYSETVPSTLHGYDTTRYTIVPEAIHASDRTPDGYVTSKELVELVEWKLKHGKFRPSLMKLAKENAEDKVRNTTAAAFAHLAKAKAAAPGNELPWKAIEMAMSDVVELRGVGPATASLVLSCFDPVSIPFFSDELFRLFHWLDKPGKGSERGWERKITYTLKEYRSIIERVQEFRKAMAVNGKAWDCVELEKAAWVLGKEGVDIGSFLEPEKNSLTANATGGHDGQVGTASLAAGEKPIKNTGEKRRRYDPTVETKPVKKPKRTARSKQLPD